MAKKDIRFTLDTIDSKYSPVGTVKQLDSVFFYIKITENGVTKDLTGQTIKLFAVKGDKKLVEQITKINITNETEGLVEIELLNAAIQVHGFTYFELEISDNTGIISTSDFILRVDRRIGSDEAIESTNEVATLKEIEIYVAQAKVELQRFKELQTEMLMTNETINSNEEGRVNAEKKRVLAEEERGTLFAQKEVERNNTFTQGERERNETFEEAESNRAVAESERVIAEQERKEKFAGFENKINLNTEELKAARSATTGEEFTTLDERIDCEVDRLNKKIEVSMLQQEDKESHTVENTVDGMTTDMFIKGRTLQNLWKPQTIQWEPTNKWFNALSSSVIHDITGKVITVKNITEKTINFQFSKLDNNYDSQIVINGGEIKVITVTSLQKFRGVIGLESLGWQNTNEDKNRLINGLIICIGEHSFLPNLYFEGIKSFGEQEGNRISILSRTENLLDTNVNSENVEDGVFYDYKTGRKNTLVNAFTVNIPLKANTTFSMYGINRNVSYWKDGVFQGSVFKEFADDSFNTQVSPNFDSVLKVTVLKANKDLAYVVLGDKEMNPYQQYKQDKKDISLSEYGFDEGLRGLNNSVYDELSSIRNVAVKRVGKYTMTGNEQLTGDLRSDFIYCSFKLEGSVPRSGTEAICNQFIYVDRLWDSEHPSANGKEGFDLSGSDILSFQLPISKLETPNTDGIKKYFKSLYDSGNPVIVYYELAEPVETPLDENINLKVFNEKTYVNFENALSGTSSFKAPVNAAATISRLNRENRALEEENRNLRQDFESTTLTLTDSDLDLVKQNVDMDFRLMEVEFALDIPQAILSSNIKFKNKKGEVKSMARTPYEMMKIVILSGDYDREDYMYKVGKYYERGRMTKEEHDELMSLMTADEVISK
ncbi:BppU family phage baseplate upper protein [Clostridium perfringens]|uniref:BppU family phage baseplate upper protein n=1 Tax=Clostridium perfringens TaxID=1502 RepID=UPI0030D1C59E